MEAIRKTEAETKEFAADIRREYRHAYHKHGAPNGLPLARFDLAKATERLNAVREENAGDGICWLTILQEEVLEMIEAAKAGNYEHFRQECAQCGAVLSRIDDYVAASLGVR